MGHLEAVPKSRALLSSLLILVAMVTSMETAHWLLISPSLYINHKRQSSPGRCESLQQFTIILDIVGGMSIYHV